MIKFFRHIRRKLLEQNQMGKYFKYAIGEIILVVIGILIALQINNWNEKRKDEAKLQTILLKIKEDLKGDLLVVNNNLYTLKRKDSIAHYIFNKTIDQKTFSEIGGSFLPFTSLVLDLNNSGYEQLKVNIDKLPASYKDLVTALNDIYINTKSNLDIYNKLMDQAIEKHLNTLSETKPWFSDWSRNIPSVEADMYFLTDSLAKNRISLYLQNLNSTAYEGFSFKQKSITAIKLIDSLTQTDVEMPSIASTNLDNESIRKQLVGTYALVEDLDNDLNFSHSELQISEEEQTLFLKVGDNFNPELHEALTTTNDSKIDDDIIVEIYESGYKYKDLIIRHAKVVVNKK